MDRGQRPIAIDRTVFEEIANKAKSGCPVSKLFKAKITMDARLEG
jgi:osmotically inducible protein OsmC